MKYIHVGCALSAALFLASCSATGETMRSHDTASTSASVSASAPPAPSTPASSSTGNAPDGLGYGVGLGGRKNPNYEPGDVIAR